MKREPRHNSAIYVGMVMHRRTRPRRHRLAYEVCSFLIDLDEVDELDRTVVGFGHNRFNLFSFHDRDHGAGDGLPLRSWVENHLAKAGIDLHGGSIRLLCYPRILGYVFNPLSVYYCYRREGDGVETLAALCYEVTNTFKQRHTYLIPVTSKGGELVRQSCAKALYVSPFMAMDMTYHFRVRPPGDDLSVVIQETDRQGALLFASFSGRRQNLSSVNVLRAFLAFPLQTLKVIGGIHWEALKLWLKGVPVVHRPSPPSKPVSIITGTIEEVPPATA
ncbi:MAG: DUF1365 domain-containing protein [Rhodospirillaceae bacterium]|nr:MAG: DUF1365 domain-containing protein [Rhodospirillaceae bacterium]